MHVCQAKVNVVAYVKKDTVAQANTKKDAKAQVAAQEWAKAKRWFSSE